MSIYPSKNPSDNSNNELLFIPSYHDGNNTPHHSFYEDFHSANEIPFSRLSLEQSKSLSNSHLFNIDRTIRPNSHPIGPGSMNSSCHCKLLDIPYYPVNNVVHSPKYSSVYNKSNRYQENVHSSIASGDELSFRQSLNSDNGFSVDSQYIVPEDMSIQTHYGQRNYTENTQLNIPHFRNRPLPMVTRNYHSYSSRGIFSFDKLI